MQTILVIDDNAGVCQALEVLFSLHDLHTIVANTPDQGLALLRAEPVDLVIQDMNFSADTTSGDEGKALFEAIRRHDPDVPVILFTAWTDLESAVELVKAGAADYIAKPWDDDKLVATARNLLELRAVSRAQQRLLGERRQRRQSLAAEYDLCGTVYESEAMHDVLLMAARVAGSDVPVLITGPNGAGKEKIAQVVQANSRRASAPFLTVNMGALPSELMESELFGAEAGAYTGANKARAGRFEVADGGTLFLDEIGNLSLPGQAKLLRVLQTGEFERLGSNVTRRTSVRVLSATNMDLKEAIAAGTFREDLFYRLNVIELRIPALAERPDDILPLARHFLGDNYDIPGETERAMLAYPWPGNVRELRNAMERARVLATGRRIAPDLLGLEKLESGGPARDTPAPADSIDRRQLQEALVRHDGIVARAARDLGLSRQAFYRRMDKHGIPRD